MHMAKKDVLKGRSIVGKNVFDQANKSIEEIKRANPIIEIFKKYGVKLTDTCNGEYKGLCPFHNDTNPSLSVNGIKQVFNCFGCGKSGTVIDAVALFENVTRDEAIRMLRDKTVKYDNQIFPEEKENLSQDLPDLKLDLRDLTEESDNIVDNGNTIDNDNAVDNESLFTLNHVIDQYHKKLYENIKAVEYLNKRGIKSPEIIDRFKIGFADGSLVHIIGESQKIELKKFGILRENGTEHFARCIVFPVFDDTCGGQCTGIYGRSIDDNAKVKHLYLKGKHQGVFNRKASKVYDEIILTESIIDCLSLIELGFENVQACYGVNGFTEEHLETLKVDRVKTIIIAFDNDEAGIRSGGEQKEKLLIENFKVKIIVPSSGKDWNDSLREGVGKDEIQGLIEKAEVFKLQPASCLDVKKDGFGYMFSIGEINYSISNVKDGFSNNLKVNVRTEYQGERFPDNVDLYSSRSRDNLSLKLNQKFGIESKRIEKDLLLILDYLEEEQRNRLNPDTEEKKELTEEETKAGMRFLKSLDLFKSIVDDMTMLGYVGEDLNKQLLYLCATSRLMDDPISVMIVSQSASGKSYLVDTVSKLIPENEVIEFHTLSQQALQYMGEKLLNKFMTMGEATHDKDIENQLRQILSGHKLSRYVVVKNEKTGEMTTEQVLVRAVVASVLTTTSSKINPENASRYFIVNTDESVNQTVRIYEAQKSKYSEERANIKENVIPDIISKHHAAQRLLKKITIVIPSMMRNKLKFPDKVMRLRRDHERFIDLIAVVCFLRQYQKETKNNGRFDYIECDKTDYRIAYTILINDVLQSTISEIPQQSVMIYEAVREIARANADAEGIKAFDVTVFQREIREHTGFNQMFVKRYIRLLVDYEYLKAKHIGRGSKCGYSLIADEDLNHIDISMIPTPDMMDAILNEADG
jgi:DNA primase